MTVGYFVDHFCLKKTSQFLYWLIACAFVDLLVERLIIALISPTTVLNGLQASCMKPALVPASL